MVALITAAVFAIVSLIVMSVYRVATAESPVERRLRSLGTDPAARARQEAAAKGPGLVGRFAAAVGKWGVGGGAGSLTQTLSTAGFRSSSAVTIFLGARTLLSFGPALLVLMYRVSSGKPVGGALWISILVWAIGYVGTNAWLRRRANRRRLEMTSALPDSLDLMVVCLESGLGLNATIARVGEERSALNDPLGNEFAQVSFELRSGRSREESLRSLGERNGAEDLKSLSGLIIQSDRLGASMAKTLRAHADLLRTKRRQRAEEAARKLPIKVLFPLATMLLPPLFIMVAGPAFLKFKDLIKMLVER